MRLFVSSQSRVPGFSFSRRIKSFLPRTDFLVTPPESFSTQVQPLNAAAVPALMTPLSNSRRVMPRWLWSDLPRLERPFFGFIVPFGNHRSTDGHRSSGAVALLALHGL